MTTALVHALPLMLDARVLASIGLPLLAALVAWGALLATAWRPFADVLARTFGGGTALGFTAWLVDTGAKLMSFGVITVGSAVLALVAIAVLAGGVFVRVVATRHFPDLEAKQGGTMRGSLANALGALLVWVPLALAALPLWFVPPLALAAGWVLNAWLNQRLFRYDALAVHASAAERRTVVRLARGRLMLLGLVLAPLAFIPVFNLVLPLYSGLAFTHLCLAELAAHRGRAAQLAPMVAT